MQPPDRKSVGAYASDSFVYDWKLLWATPDQATKIINERHDLGAQGDVINYIDRAGLFAPMADLVSAVEQIPAIHINAFKDPRIWTPLFTVNGVQGQHAPVYVKPTEDTLSTDVYFGRGFARKKKISQNGYVYIAVKKIDALASVYTANGVPYSSDPRTSKFLRAPRGMETGWSGYYAVPESWVVWTDFEVISISTDDNEIAFLGKDRRVYKYTFDDIWQQNDTPSLPRATRAELQAAMTRFQRDYPSFTLGNELGPVVLGGSLATAAEDDEEDDDEDDEEETPNNNKSVASDGLLPFHEDDNSEASSSSSSSDED